LRIVRPGPPEERNRRGTVGATLRLAAFFADNDGDKNRGTICSLRPSAEIETSPGNSHPWFVFNPAVNDATRAGEVGKRLKKVFGGDSNSFVPTQPARLAGTVNYPTRKKLERGRTPCATSIRYLNGPRYTLDQLEAVLPPAITKRKVVKRLARAGLITGGAKSYAVWLIARPVDPRDPSEPVMADRSRWFFHCIRSAVFARMTVDEIESVMRDYMRGCAEKYLFPTDRLRDEIIRCYDKIELVRNRDALAELLDGADDE
jgi:hypothetical protein